MKNRVLILGSVNTDLVVKIGRLPKPGETVIGGTFYQNQGGKGANQAVAAARCGGSGVTLIAAVGDDTFGQQSLAELKKESLDLSPVFVKKGVPSGVALIMVDNAGENAIAVASGANGVLSPEDIETLPDSLFESASVLLTCFEIPVETVWAGLKRAKKHGVTTILNPAPVPEKWPRELFSAVDVVTPNEHELAQLVAASVVDKATARDAAERLLALGVQRVIVTLGAHGAMLVEPGAVHHVPAFSVLAVDTTGAGDAFNGALAVAISEGRDWINCLEWASAAAALSVTRYGAQPSLPWRHEIEDFLKAHR